MLVPFDPPPKGERLAEVWRRLEALGPFASGSEALSVLCQTINNVEDELSGVAKDLEAAKRGDTGGRMYPPDEEFRFDCGSPLVAAYKQTGHITYFGANGSIRVQRKRASVEFEMLGADLRSVAELFPEIPK